MRWLAQWTRGEEKIVLILAPTAFSLTKWWSEDYVSDRDVDWELAEQLGSDSCDQQHKAQLEASGQQGVPRGNTGTHTV